ncbi:DUF350 domain-containing protein [Desulfatitalea alkaliphila]|uniref:DUF350 domain-containing protein n=1 Tax=Desulfatitalea alkaliphila TaxID=2929485 RepID=A0AA41R238_9BACT|nr:DUF350 domain-containing protein [Desulfatitalea alkaliphila]MCJ8499430.1 hypothetical protein [Desulfatitalea alkaliphila]
MGTGFLSVTLFNLGINLVYTLVALLVGMAALIFVDKQLFKKICFQEELRKGNMAIALFASAILLFVALIVTFGFKG